MQELASRLEAVTERLRQACRAAGRDPAAVQLLCVTKTVAPATIRVAYQAGARDFGENYAQDLRDKAAALADLGALRWHFIGALQRNKVKYVVGRAGLIHSLDSLPLLEAVERRAAGLGLVQSLLCEVNLAGEASKSGVAPAELPRLLDGFAACPHCRCLGLMTMPPFYDEPERARPFFAGLRQLADTQAAVDRRNVELQHLSMGMSGDFEVAIQEGATMVRVGTAIFGAR